MMADGQPSSITLRIPGVEDYEAVSGSPSPSAYSVIEVHEKRTFQINAAREGTSEGVELATAPDDVFEIELDDGTRLWTTRQRLCEELQQIPASRGADDVIDLPANLALGRTSRGWLGKALIKTLRFFRIDVPRLAAQQLASTLESKTVAGVPNDQDAALFHCGTTDAFRLTPWRDKPGGIPTDQPILLFLHGTGSSTDGSFGELWHRDRRALRQRLFSPYRDNVFALEHRTLSASPIDNAITLARELPARTKLHLISHSRGGLIGELICRAWMVGGQDPFDADDLTVFNTRGSDDGRGDLKTLNRLLKEKQFQVERFTRVACPARGTSLASERLDLYLSCLVNLLETVTFVSTPGVGAIIDILTELVMAIAKERSDPSVLPGLEAMMPESSLVAVLNRPDRRINGELRVIAGDIEGGSLTSSLGTLLTDPLYLGDHDLVVNTDSMFGGAERQGGAAFSFHRGADVSHFNYFKNPESAGRLVKAMTRTGQEDDGFQSFDIGQTDREEPFYRGESESPRPVVFVLPGIMGSHLSIGGDRIWLDLGDLAFGGLARLKIDTAVRPEGLIRMAYGRLVRYLSNIYDVVQFPYDWRTSIADEADRLADEIRRKLDEVEPHNQPISILAHSMGGLVARTLIAKHPELWQRMGRYAESRLVMMGTPNGGSYIIPYLLTGRESLLKKLALLDLKNTQLELLDVIRDFPGLLELMPENASLDLFSAANWTRLKNEDDKEDAWQSPPTEDRLNAAKEVRDLMNRGPVDPTRMVYVAGCAPATLMNLEIEAGTNGSTRLVFHATPQGDGRVPWATGRLPDVKTWYMDAAHGDLADHEMAFPALLELLQNGSTDRLPTTAPVNRGVAERFEMSEERSPLYPNLEDLTRSALGSNRQSSKGTPEHKARVSVVHGHLECANHPVMVGHYQGDTIISAEAHLDRVLDGRLRDQHRLELYPGPQGTAEVFFPSTDDQAVGAIVVGLGEVGRLSTGNLIQAISRGARAYALAVGDARYQSGNASSGRRSACISVLLIGTGAGGLTVETSVTAILRGMAHANQSLEDSGYSERVIIDQVEFIELYEDRAIQAAHALKQLKDSVDLGRRFRIDEELQVARRHGALRRTSFFQDDAWWSRLQILEDQQSCLTFNLLTDRARTEIRLQPTQRVLVDQFIEDAIRTPSPDMETAVTLFEMLIPNELKDDAPEQRDMVLVLDAGSARYPWELLYDRQAQEGVGAEAKPLAIQSGMVRQLQTTEYRQQVLMSKGKSVLVVGDPPSDFTPLPGAVEEAEKVAKLFDTWDFKVELLSRKPAKDILKKLYAQDYRIVHLAGHGVYQYDPKSPTSRPPGKVEDGASRFTGMVIGKNQFLTPGEIRQMRAVPELVFINCCHLGRIEDPQAQLLNDPPKLAANVATELIRMGVKAVVAAGWAVDDQAAQTFAETLYHEMLSGGAFGRAVHRARIETFEKHPAVNTWGAYQCYGDPAFTLSQSVAARVSKRPSPQFVASAEVLTLLDNISENATTASDAEIADLRTQVGDMVEHIPTNWRNTGEMHAALGRAFGELGLFQKAVKEYRSMIHVEKAEFPLHAVEQLCNLEVRWAEHDLWPSDPKQVQQCVDQAKQRLQQLIDTFGQTVERYSIMGSIAKRESVMAPDLETRQKALKQMSEYYEKAYQHGVEEKQQVDPYPLLNWLTGEVLQNLLTSRPRKPSHLQLRLERASNAAEENHRQEPNFWNAVIPVDCQLIEHIAARNLDQHVGKLAVRYMSLKEQIASPREFRSVIDQIRFLAKTIEWAPNDNVKHDLGSAFAELERSLTV